LLPHPRIFSVKTHAAVFRRVMSEPKERRRASLNWRYWVEVKKEGQLELPLLDSGSRGLPLNYFG